MKKLFAILFLLIIVTGTSGCTVNPQANGTFGEKNPVSISDISILNDTGTYDTFGGKGYYYIEGYLKNRQGEDAYNVTMQAKFYDKNDKLIATNESAYIDPKVVPGNGQSYYYIDAQDPEKKIVRYEIKITGVR